MKPSLTIVILTRDEADQIAACIAAAKLLQPDDILVIDSESTDETVQIARQSGARVEIHPWLGYVDQRNLAWKMTNCDWLFFIDADERITEALAKELPSLLANNSLSVIEVHRRNWFQGAPLYCIEPDRLPRIARRDNSRWVGGHVHEWLESDGKTALLEPPILHRSWENLAEQLDKNQRYAKLMADTRSENGSRYRPWMLLRPLWAFPKFLVLRGGWREGRRGLLFALTYFVYALQKILFMMETDIQKNGLPVPFPEPGLKSEKETETETGLRTDK